MNLHDVRTPASKIIKDHTPSISTIDENTLLDQLFAFDPDLDDVADLAIRTCHCGTRIDGFYEYTYHIQAELMKAGYQ